MNALSRIIICNHHFNVNDGQGQVNLRVAEHLLERGHHLVLIGGEPPPAIREHERCDWVPVETAKLRPAVLRYALFSFLIRSKIARFYRPELDLLCVNGTMYGGRVDVNCCHFVHSAWIRSAFHPLHEGGVRGWYQGWLTRREAVSEARVYPLSQVVVPVSSQVGRDLERYCGLPEERQQIITNGVDIKGIDQRGRVARARLLQLSGTQYDDAFLLFFAGGISTPRKNAELIIRSLTRLPPRVHLVIAGGFEGSACPVLAMSLGVADRVHFLGHRKDVFGLYGGADLFVFPSHYDPFALVVAEAMAAGLPVVCSPEAGASQLIEPGVNGWVLAHSNDGDGLVRHVEALLGDPDLVVAMGQAARATAEAISWDRVCERYAILFESLLEGKRL